MEEDLYDFISCSNCVIDTINFSLCRPYKDFGRGFYCTEIKEQADLMAKRVANIYGGIPYVTAFELDEKIYENEQLHIRVFTKPTREWLSLYLIIGIENSQMLRA